MSRVPWEDHKPMDIFMPYPELKISAKENLLDHHIHLHTHEIMPGRWLRPKSRNQAGIFSKFLWGALVGIGIIGAVWLQW